MNLNNDEASLFCLDWMKKCSRMQIFDTYAVKQTLVNSSMKSNINDFVKGIGLAKQNIANQDTKQNKAAMQHHSYFNSKIGDIWKVPNKKIQKRSFINDEEEKLENKSSRTFLSSRRSKTRPRTANGCMYRKGTSKNVLDKCVMLQNRLLTKRI